MDIRALTLRVIDRAGLGQACSMLTVGRLQILCYHGFSFHDEHLFRRKLFMTPDLFERRLEWLARNRYVVLGLSEAIARLEAGKIRRKEIVITIDDGFYSVIALAAPLLRSHGMTATVYVTTYYVAHQNPIFRLAIQYLAWKSDREMLDLAGLLPQAPHRMLPLRGPAAAGALQAFYENAERVGTEADRVALAREFGIRAGVEYDELARSRRLTLLSTDEIASLNQQGFDIQLHTHRHRLPLDAAQMGREISDNRRILGPLTNAPLDHLCYPSGIWDPAQWPTLSALGIRSATTCLPGFNSRHTQALGLRRFLDGQEIPMSEFAAEMRGVKDLHRRVKAAMSPRATGLGSSEATTRDN